MGQYQQPWVLKGAQQLHQLHGGFCVKKARTIPQVGEKSVDRLTPPATVRVDRLIPFLRSMVVMMGLVMGYAFEKNQYHYQWDLPLAAEWVLSITIKNVDYKSDGFKS